MACRARDPSLSLGMTVLPRAATKNRTAASLAAVGLPKSFGDSYSTRMSAFAVPILPETLSRTLTTTRAFPFRICSVIG